MLDPIEQRLVILELQEDSAERPLAVSTHVLVDVCVIEVVGVAADQKSDESLAYLLEAPSEVVGGFDPRRPLFLQIAGSLPMILRKQLVNKVILLHFLEQLRRKFVRLGAVQLSLGQIRKLQMRDDLRRELGHLFVEETTHSARQLDQRHRFRWLYRQPRPLGLFGGT